MIARGYGRFVGESRYDCHRQSLRLKIRCALQHAPTMVSHHFHRTLVGDGALDVPFRIPAILIDKNPILLYTVVCKITPNP